MMKKKPRRRNERLAGRRLAAWQARGLGHGMHVCCRRVLCSASTPLPSAPHVPSTASALLSDCCCARVAVSVAAPGCTRVAVSVAVGGTGVNGVRGATPRHSPKSVCFESKPVRSRHSSDSDSSPVSSSASSARMLLACWPVHLAARCAPARAKGFLMSSSFFALRTSAAETC